MTWDRESLAWLAGLLEGEGSFGLRRHVSTGRVTPLVQMDMTDEDVIRRAHLVAGLGTVCLSPRQSPRKDAWVWSVQNQYHAYALMVALYPWMGERRQQRIWECVNSWLDTGVSTTRPPKRKAS